MFYLIGLIEKKQGLLNTNDSYVEIVFWYCTPSCVSERVYTNIFKLKLNSNFSAVKQDSNKVGRKLMGPKIYELAPSINPTAIIP